MPNDTENRGFHGSPEKYIKYSKTALLAALDEGKITSDDASLLREFINEISVNMSPGRKYKYYHTLISWRTFVGPFRENQADDLFDGIELLNMYRQENGKYYSLNTKIDYIRFLKRFYMWLRENENSTIPEKKLMKIRPPKGDRMTVTAEQLILEEEVLQMIQACWTSRDRAIIALLWESGCRIGEIGKLRWEQVQFNSWNVTINTAEKTGNPRYIPCVMALPYVAAWMNDYPLTPSGRNHVFLSINKNKPMQYRGLQKKILTIAEKAGVERKIYPHLFRHSRITDLIKKNYNESVIKLMCWGNLSTKQYETYCHLTNHDITEEIAKREGIITDENQEKSPLEARQCPQCFTINGPTSRVCSTCGLTLTKEARAERENIITSLKSLTKEQLVELIQQQIT